MVIICGYIYELIQSSEFCKDLNMDFTRFFIFFTKNDSYWIWINVSIFDQTLVFFQQGIFIVLSFCWPLMFDLIVKHIFNHFDVVFDQTPDFFWDRTTAGLTLLIFLSFLCIYFSSIDLSLKVFNKETFPSLIVYTSMLLYGFYVGLTTVVVQLPQSMKGLTLLHLLSSLIAFLNKANFAPDVWPNHRVSFIVTYVQEVLLLKYYTIPYSSTIK